LTASERVLLDPSAFASSVTSRRRIAWGSVVGGLLCAGAAALVAWFAGAQIVEAMRSRTWGTVPGRVVASEVREVTTGEGTSWEPRVTYRYEVEGRSYEGSRIDFSGWSSGRSRSEAVVRRYPDGTAVEVAVSPTDPELAALEPGPTLGTFGLFGMVLPLTGLAVFLLWRARPEMLERAAGRLDRDGLVDAPEYVESAFAVALLELERRGVVKLQLDESSGARTDVLRVVPTGERETFPSTTLEGRLAVGRERTAEEIAHLWLAAYSVHPWRRASAQLEVVAVLRGLARYAVPSRRRGTARLVGRGEPPSVEPARTLLDSCDRERPLVREAIRASVERAVVGRTVSEHAENHQERDPWLDEAVADLDALGIEDPSWRSYELWYVATSPMLWFGVFLGSGRPVVAGFWSAVGLIFFGLAALPRGPLSGVLPWIRRTVNSRTPGFVDGPLPRHLRVAGVAFGAPLVAGLGTIMTLAFDLVWVLPAAAIAGGVLLRRTLRERVTRAVTAIVTGASDPPDSDDDEDTPVQNRPQEVQAARASGADSGLPFDVRPTSSLDLPEASDRAWARVREIDERGPALRRIYRRATMGLAGGTFAVSLVSWILPGETGSPVGVGVLTAMTAIAVRFTVIAERSRCEHDTLLRQSSVRSSDRYWQRMKLWMRSPRPDGLQVLTTFWLVVSAAIVLGHMTTGGITGFVGGTAQTAVTLKAWLWVKRRRATHARLFPRRDPLGLLALRVFRSPYLDDFLDLTDLWQWVGTRQRLDGPGTPGQASRELFQYVSGRIEEAVVEDEAKLEEALAAFRSEPDRHLRFPVNSMRCSDATWKTAVRRLLDRADVVVMDLSSLGPDSRGIVWELGELAERIAWDHVVLLVHESTDMSTFRAILAEAVARTSLASPNRNRSAGPLIIDVGGSIARDADESLYDWRRRMDERVSPEHLVALLIDAAGTGMLAS